MSSMFPIVPGLLYSHKEGWCHWICPSFLHLQQSIHAWTPGLKKVSLLGILNLVKRGNVCCSDMQFLSFWIPPWWILRHRTLKIFLASPTLFCWELSAKVLWHSGLLQSLNPHSPKCVIRMNETHCKCAPVPVLTSLERQSLNTKSALILASLTPSPTVLTVHWELSLRIYFKDNIN